MCVRVCVIGYAEWLLRVACHRALRVLRRSTHTHTTRSSVHLLISSPDPRREDLFWSLALVTAVAGAFSIGLAIYACCRSWRSNSPWLSELWPWLARIAVGLTALCAFGAAVAIYFFAVYYNDLESSIGHIEDAGNEIGAWGDAVSFVTETQVRVRGREGEREGVCVRACVSPYWEYFSASFRLSL